MKSLMFIAVATLAFSAPSMAQEQTYGGYGGKGGMGARSIKANVYEYHYDKGFTGGDAMGWDPNLQYAWSRIAAADACGVSVDQDKALAVLEAAYGQEKMIQEIVGVGFHGAQIKANKAFCTESRVKELTDVIPKIEDGTFERPFK